MKETLANRIPTVEEYIGALPAIAIVWLMQRPQFPTGAAPKLEVME